MLINLLLLLRRAAIEPAILAIDAKPKQLVLGDHCFEREPPHLADTVGESRGDVDGERHLVFLQDRIGVLEIVAVAVVERDADETFLEIPLGHAAVHFIERNEIGARAPQAPDNFLEERRGHFKQPVGLELPPPRRTHVMQRHDRADAAKPWSQQHMRAAEIQRLHGNLKDIVPEAQGALDAGLRCGRAGRGMIELRRRASQYRDVGEARRQQLVTQCTRSSCPGFRRQPKWPAR